MNWMQKEFIGRLRALSESEVDTSEECRHCQPEIMNSILESKGKENRQIAVRSILYMNANKIFFDVDDTLYDLKSPLEKAFFQIYGNSCRDIDMDRLFIQFRKHSDEVFLDSQNGSISMEEMYIYRMQSACRDLKFVMSASEAMQCQKYYEYYQQRIELPDAICRLLTTLKSKGCTMGIITNGPSQHQRDKIRVLGLNQWIPEENIYVSGDYNTAKPDPALFDLAVKKIGGRPEEYIYVGDSFENDVIGAKAAGWNMIWLNRRNFQLGPDKVSPLNPESDFEVHSDGELLKLLGE